MIAASRHVRPRPPLNQRDQEILEAACELLASSSYGSLRQLSCRVVGGVVEISGTVSTFYLKQLAQAAMLQLQPEARVRNLVEVTAETPVVVATSCGPARAASGLA